MNDLFLLLLESCALLLLTGLLITLYGLRHSPEGFQHYNLFYYGAPPEGFIPMESGEAAPDRTADWR